MREFRVTVLQKGKELGSFTFDKNVVTIGRSADSDVRIDSKTVSRKQAELLRTTQGFAVFAHNSTNVTRVNGEQVPPEESVPLQPGDKIQIADRFDLTLALLKDLETTPAADSSEAAPVRTRPAPKAPAAAPGADTLPVEGHQTVPALTREEAEAAAPQPKAGPLTEALGKFARSDSKRQATEHGSDRPTAAHVREPPPSSEQRPKGDAPTAGRLPKVDPPTSGRLRKVAPPTSGRLAKVDPPTSGRLAKVDPPTSGRLAKVDPPTSGRLAKVDSLTSGRMRKGDNVQTQRQAGGPPPTGRRATLSAAPPPAGGATPILGATHDAPVPIPPPVKVEVVASARQRQGPSGARLICRLNKSERSLDVHDDFYVGGGEDSDLCLSGGYAPRRAALVVRVAGRYRLYNTSPLAETVLVNGKGIQGYADLVDGDELEVYGVALTFAAS